MASAIRSLVAEARWRGLWGTVRAIKLNKMGTMSCYGTSSLPATPARHPCPSPISPAARP